MYMSSRPTADYNPVFQADAMQELRSKSLANKQRALEERENRRMRRYTTNEYKKYVEEKKKWAARASRFGRRILSPFYGIRDARKIKDAQRHHSMMQTRHGNLTRTNAEEKFIKDHCRLLDEAAERLTTRETRYVISNCTAARCH
jgi:hypothetical protein